MPPFSQMPKPAAHKLMVHVPICEWCKERVGRACKGCERITCYMCLVSIEGGKCVHQTYKPVQSTGWGKECPNPQCDADCTTCKGIGVVWWL